MPNFYVLAHPGTVCSLIQLGCLPATDKFSAEEKLQMVTCYKDHGDCIVTTPTNLHQTFLLSVNLETSEPLPTMIKVSHIQPKQIQRVHVYSKRGEKTLLNILKNKAEITIDIAPDLYPSIEKKIVDKESKMQTSSSSSTAATSFPPTLNQVQIISGNIVNSTMQTLINTVNCVGVMGKGISLEFKNKYPDMFKDYKKKCDKNLVRLGKPYSYDIAKGRKVVNFPTKGHWREDSKLENIESGLIYLAAHLKDWGVTSLAVPPLGCTNGNLKWEDVFPLIQKHLFPIGIPLEIYSSAQVAQKKKSTITSPAIFSKAHNKKQDDKETNKAIALKPYPEEKRQFVPIPNFCTTTTVVSSTFYSSSSVSNNSTSSSSIASTTSLVSPSVLPLTNKRKRQSTDNLNGNTPPPLNKTRLE